MLFRSLLPYITAVEKRFDSRPNDVPEQMRRDELRRYTISPSPHHPDVSDDLDPFPRVPQLGAEQSQGQRQHIRAAASAVIRGDGVVADQQGEEEQTTGLDVGRVGAQGAE